MTSRCYLSLKMPSEMGKAGIISPAFKWGNRGLESCECCEMTLAGGIWLLTLLLFSLEGQSLAKWPPIQLPSVPGHATKLHSLVLVLGRSSVTEFWTRESETVSPLPDLPACPKILPKGHLHSLFSTLSDSGRSVLKMVALPGTYSVYISSVYDS